MAVNALEKIDQQGPTDGATSLGPLTILNVLEEIFDLKSCDIGRDRQLEVAFVHCCNGLEDQCYRLL